MKKKMALSAFKHKTWLPFSPKESVDLGYETFQNHSVLL